MEFDELSYEDKIKILDLAIQVEERRIEFYKKKKEADALEYFVTTGKQPTESN